METVQEKKEKLHRGVRRRRSARRRMETFQEKKVKLHQLVDSLPTDRLDVAEALMEQLQRETRVTRKEGKLIVRLGGLWKGVEITEQDIAEARQEMWGRMGQDDQ